MILVVAISYFAQKRQNEAIRQADRSAAIASCKREVARDAYEAAGILYASKVSKGKTADRFEASARSVVLSFPRPRGLKFEHVERMAEVEFVQQPNGRYRFALTDSARKLQARGCQQAYPD